MIEFTTGLILRKTDKSKTLKWNHRDYKPICDTSIYKKKNYNPKDDKQVFHILHTNGQITHLTSMSDFNPTSFIYTSRSITKQNIVKVYNENEYTKISTQQKLMKQLFYKQWIYSFIIQQI